MCPSTPTWRVRGDRENDFNLNIPRYVDTFEVEPDVDVKAVQAEIKEIDTRLEAVEQELKQWLKELGFDG